MLKCLQIQPDKEVIIEFIKNEDYKYVRVLGVPPPPAMPQPALVSIHGLVRSGLSGEASLHHPGVCCSESVK